MLEIIRSTSKDKNIKFTFYSSYKDIPQKDWNSFNTANTIYLTLPYLSILEEALNTTIDFWYIIFYVDKVPVGIAYTQLIKVKPDQITNQTLPCKLTDHIKNFFIKNIEVKSLVCGNLFACGEHGFLFSDNVTDDEAIKALDKALKDIRKVAHPEDKPSFILLKEFWLNNTMLQSIKEMGYRDFEIDMNMVLYIRSNWKSFDAYLADLKTKFRTRVKKTFEKSSAIHIQELSHADIERYKEKIDLLYLSVIENADFKFGNLNANTFILLKQRLKDKFIFKGFFSNEELVGFSSAFWLDNILEANHIGLNYKINKSHHLYQRMLYEYVNMAITLKVTELRLGRTAETIKSAVGAAPVPMKLFIKHGNALSNKLLRPLVDVISPNDYEIRNPFKTQVH